MSDNREYDLEWRKVLENFIGYGDPDKADYFFFGLEEKEEDKKNIDPSCKESEQDRLEFYRKTKANFSNSKYYWIDTKDLYNKIPKAKECDSEYNPTLGAFCKFYKVLKNEDIEQIEIGSSDHKIFNGNIFPFPKKEHPQTELLEKERIELLTLFIKEKIFQRSKVLFFFGKNNWVRIKDIIKQANIDVDSFEEEMIIVDGRKTHFYQFDENNRIFLMNHPSRASNFSETEFSSLVIKHKLSKIVF